MTFAYLSLYKCLCGCFMYIFTSQLVLRLSTIEVVVSWDPLIAQTLHTQQTLSKRALAGWPHILLFNSVGWGPVSSLNYLDEPCLLSPHSPLCSSLPCVSSSHFPTSHFDYLCTRVCVRRMGVCPLHYLLDLLDSPSFCTAQYEADWSIPSDLSSSTSPRWGDIL